MRRAAHNFRLYVYGCDCGTWACRVDSILHRLRVHLRPLCDLHDEQIRGVR